MALETIPIDRRGLREVLIHLSPIPFYGIPNLIESYGEEVYQDWMDLDRILVKLLELHVVRVKVIHFPNKKSEEVRAFMKDLLPGTMMRQGTEL